MGEFSKHNEEDNETWNPAVVFVGVHYFVAKESNNEGASCDHNDAAPTRDVTVDRVQYLSAHNDVHGRPAYAGENVEEGDCGGLVCELTAC